MKILLQHAELNSESDIIEYYIDSFTDLIDHIKLLLNYDNCDRVFILINDDYYENGNGKCIYEVYDLYINNQISSIIRYLQMMNDTNSFKIKNGEDFISISIHECASYEEAYKSAVDLMETSPNCYDN